MEGEESKKKLKFILIVAVVTVVILAFLFMGGKPLDDFKKWAHINTTGKEPGNGTNNSSSGGGGGSGSGGGGGGAGVNGSSLLGGVGNMTDEELKNAINNSFSGENGTTPPENGVIIYAPEGFVEIAPNTTDGVGIGIENLDNVSGATSQFSYVVTYVGNSDCGISKEEAESWIVAGESENNITLESGQIMTAKILFRIPEGAPACTIRFKVDVQKDGVYYATDFFDIEIMTK